MGMALNVEMREMLQLLSFCSHVLEDFTEVKAGLLVNGLVDEMEQLEGMRSDVSAILAKIDREDQSLISLPKDGVPWRDRVPAA